MVATQMAKAKGPKKTPGDGELSSLKVRKKAQLVISKLTSLRALRSVADLFEERDVEDFFRRGGGDGADPGNDLKIASTQS